MRTHRGSQVTTLFVVLLAVTPLGARAQSPPSGPAGYGALSSPMTAGAPVSPVAAAPMPMAAAPSAMGYGGVMPYGIAPGMVGPPQAYGYPASPAPNGGVYPAMFSGDPNAPQPLPAGPAPSAAYDAQMPGYYGAAMAECSSCGGAGCPGCMGIAGFLARGASWLLPFSEAGICAPRWYDITADFVYLQRDNAGRQMDFASQGILGPIVLSTNSLEFDPSGALQLTAATQVTAGGTLEFTFLGLNNWESAASVTSDSDDLFSVISDFGTNPLLGYDETDRARTQSISYSSSVDSFELHFRKRWQGPNCRLQGSWLAGARYIYLLEDFQYFTLGGDYDPLPGLQSRGQMTYDVRAKNSVTGFQCGGDIWTCVIPGVSFGGEMKAGIYGNYAQQSTHIIATTTVPAQTNEAYENDTTGALSFVGQGSVTLVYKTSPNWALRGGYTFLFLDGVALAPENFIATAPFSTARPAPSVNDNGNVFLHGFTAGVEWMW